MMGLMRLALLLIVILSLKINAMDQSFENLYFKLYPDMLGNFSPVYWVLITAVSHDENGKGVYPKGKQKAFIQFLLKKKKMSLEDHPNVWGSAINFAAKTGNAEGVCILVELGAEKHPEKSIAISLAVDAWLSKKQVRTNCTREKQINQDYFDIIKYLLACNFSPHYIKTVHNICPIKLAMKHQQKLPGLLDLFVLHADPTEHVCEFSLEELKLLLIKYEERKEHTRLLA